MNLAVKKGVYGRRVELSGWTQKASHRYHKETEIHARHHPARRMGGRGNLRKGLPCGDKRRSIPARKCVIPGQSCRRSPVEKTKERKEKDPRTRPFNHLNAGTGRRGGKFPQSRKGNFRSKAEEERPQKESGGSGEGTTTGLLLRGSLGRSHCPKTHPARR